MWIHWCVDTLVCGHISVRIGAEERPLKKRSTQACLDAKLLLLLRVHLHLHPIHPCVAHILRTRHTNNDTCQQEHVHTHKHMCTCVYTRAHTHTHYLSRTRAQWRIPEVLDAGHHWECRVEDSVALEPGRRCWLLCKGARPAVHLPALQPASDPCVRVYTHLVRDMKVCGWWLESPWWKCDTNCTIASHFCRQHARGLLVCSTQKVCLFAARKRFAYLQESCMTAAPFNEPLMLQKLCFQCCFSFSV